MRHATDGLTHSRFELPNIFDLVILIFGRVCRFRVRLGVRRATVVGPIALTAILASVVVFLGVGSPSSVSRSARHLTRKVEATVLSLRGLELATFGCSSDWQCFGIAYRGSHDWLVTFSYQSRVTYQRTAGVTGVIVQPTGISCSSPGVCILVGTSVRDGDALILESSNGGRRWRPVPSPPMRDALVSLACFARESCMAAGVHGVLYSDDGWRHWSFKRLPRNVFTVGSLDCMTRMLCVGTTAPGVYGGFAILTRDGGSAWSEIGVHGGSHTQVWPLSCFSDSDCIALTQSQYAGEARPIERVLAYRISIGSSTTVSQFGKELTAGTIDAANCWRSNACVLAGSRVGSSGLWAYTLNSGRDWNFVGIPRHDSLNYDVWCSSDGRCVTNGSNGGRDSELLFAHL
jgi:hypothetical protein